MTIEEIARQQEKSQFTQEEYNSLHDKHGINSPFGIGYYLGATEQQKRDDEKFDEFLTGLRSANIWEGREWKYQRLWREAKEAMEE